MARSRGGRRLPPPDLLTDLTADEPEATTRPAAPAKQHKTPHPEPSPDIAAELQRVVAQLDALVKQCAELSAGVKRSAGAEADATAAIGELRGVVEAAAQGMKQAREDLSERLAAIEASVGELPAVPRAAGEIVEQLKLARSSLVGLSERMEGLERRLPETLEAIERAAVAVRETAATLAATAKTLDAAARSNAQVLPKVKRIEGDVGVLRKYALAWSLLIPIVVIVAIVLEAAARFGLLQRLAAIL